MNSNRAAATQRPRPCAYPQRTDRQAPRLREIDLSSLPYVPLPRAPMRWDTQSGRAHPQMQQGEALFEIHDAPWQLASIEKLASHERPDPAFRLRYPVDSGLLMFDDLGHARGFGPIQAAALR
jgi:hypothetical protein